MMERSATLTDGTTINRRQFIRGLSVAAGCVALPAIDLTRVMASTTTVADFPGYDALDWIHASYRYESESQMDVWGKLQNWIDKRTFNMRRVIWRQPPEVISYVDFDKKETIYRGFVRVSMLQ